MATPATFLVCDIDAGYDHLLSVGMDKKIQVNTC